MADDNRTLEYLLLGVIAGGFLTFLAMTINNQLQLLNQNLSTYNQSLLYQPQYSYAQIPQVQQVLEQPLLQSTAIDIPVQKYIIPKKEIFTVNVGNDGLIKYDDL